MDKITQPTILIIVGISGDLSQRYLLPAIRTIAASGVLPEQFRIVGITRRDDLTLDEVLPPGDNAFLAEHTELYQMNLADPAAYATLKQYLESIEQGFGTSAQRLFYLSVPPQVSQPIVSCLGASGLAAVDDTKLLLEKPFGTDLGSAKELVDDIQRHFQEAQLYRIDHYLAKEMSQNLVAFRRNNPLFAQTWNHNFVEKIDIMTLEYIDIEGRISFYEQTGALRDVLQSHILQLAALTLMDANDTSRSIPELRLQALQNLLPPDDVAQHARRGQYETYHDQVGNQDSTTETFASLTLYSKDPAWEGVPITLTTGKALNTTTTEIHLHYRRHDDDDEPNELVLHVQPNEGIALKLWVKEPGYGQKLRQLPLDFSYEQHFDDLPQAYERVFVDAMRGDHNLFTTSQEVLESWRILDPVQHAWSMHDGDLFWYKPGSTLDEVIAAANGPQ